MKESVTAIFDIGKTNKKLILFGNDLGIVLEEEKKFHTVEDDEGFECDDIDSIERWIVDTVKQLSVSDKYDLRAVNFTTYGATLAYLGEDGKRLTPIYNYLKPIDDRIPENIYKRYGGRDEFCRRSASPALGMLNSGIQVLWLKSTKPEIYSKVKHILHFPQYLSYILTGKIYSEHTSIGCHTALWDFDNMTYHPWVRDYNLNLPQPSSVSTVNEVVIEGKTINVGIGIHDSSASLAPYFESSEKFLLLSTGTWCINMNPFNTETLTSEQLDMDCLCYMSIGRKPVKSSRIFLGHMHEEAVAKIANHFMKPAAYFRTIKTDPNMIAIIQAKYDGKKIFYKSAPDSMELREFIDMYEFVSYEEAYHQLMNELCELTVESIKLILPSGDDTSRIYITGGFSGNEVFRNYIIKAFPSKKVIVSEIVNASALGAAIVVSGLKSGNKVNLDYN